MATKLHVIRNPTPHKQMFLLTPDWEIAVAGWIDWLTTGGAPRTTIRTRRGHVRATARRLQSLAPADVMTTQLVQLFGRQQWSNEHRRGLRTSLVAFYDWAIANDFAEINPANGLPKVPESKPHPKPATDRIWKQVLIAADARERIAARLACEVGLRRAEVACVHTRDLIEDFDGSSLIVNGKGSKQRVVPIPDDLAAEIRRGPGGHTIGRGNDGYLFPGNDNGHLSAAWVGTLIGNLMPDGWSMHKLRHRFATRAYAGSRNLRAVQEALGHASVATTERYTAVSGSEVRAAVLAAQFVSSAA
ncbi:MAG: tyrosine-type recombinase/integrase [Rhodococcus sp. (in: high G+C Gram-positive bacteria)]|uniref:tyrosine-type recombinase/integrase n=1 Tax=Rhodococcus sp. TaxID=1831 RepID=UPI002AD6534F|nr:tyrosine-type recombinase/integrase [Rhodococcus sp. (in: high G+C Gram-positive bacteria)]MDZ7914051.1 tyrosine-type recombinase/integrase [Rhodococcus sp. (in: high G+C Gram-positive bacteria)]